MTEREFWATTPRFFAARVKAHDDRLKWEFEQRRTATFLACSPYLKKHATLNRFWPSPWQQVKKIEWQPVDPEALARFERDAEVALAELRQKRENGDN